MKRLLLLVIVLAVIAALLLLLWRRLSGQDKAKRDLTQADASQAGWPLFVFPLPAAIAALVALIGGQLGMLLGDVFGYGLMLGGALLVRLGSGDRRAIADWLWRRLSPKTLGALLLAFGSGITAWLGAGHHPGIALAFGLLTLLGVHLAYGLGLSFQPRLHRRLDLGAQGAASLREAARTIAAIEQARLEIRQPELSARLAKIAALAQQILERVNDDPRDLWRARKFLTVYLEGVQRVVEGYAKTHGRVAAPELEQRFRHALETVETAFREQHQVLLERDVEDLDVQIEVLTQQLAREGML
ncbi:5-bromo-4-chloroindolyl phosphate hydrolysis family protein [Lamprobacter modestohalophilus]|uniref:5-bromo-4-chloroindolyl phosphate hydrolysis family protein n=1 Tax=Lamprobacter modestohalophilus TaxID=1064514 RepID=UPI002ADEBB5A|nr:5-bromo-4-chloroindolyl phosphate hydrolysis family protein [Lamprobacter modestohalophilus]MEA1049832.1 5-bromo-4-chloroindolyl phosphate hydrolysis family protein [Lamprobacter modestohalophilus]